MLHGSVSSFFNRTHIHSVHLLTGYAVCFPARAQTFGFGGRPRGGSSHGIAIILNDKHHRQFPNRGHVIGFINLALVGGPVSKISKAHIFITTIFVGKSKPCPQWYLRSHDAMAAEEIFLTTEHMH